MSTNGRFLPAHSQRATHHMVVDSFCRVQVYRERGQTPVASFRTRIAMATSGVAGILRERVQGDAGKVYHYMSAPLRADIQQGDTVWQGSVRYRVVATEARAHQTQVLLQRIQ